jgi:tetratricopeptide (TPR) repeat protein
MRRVLGEEHRLTLALMGNLGQTLGDLGELPEAETLLRQTVETMRRVLGNKHPFLAHPLVGLAEVLLKKGKPTEARGLVQEALTIRQTALPEDHDEIAYTRSVLGECLTALGRYDEAESLVLESYDRLKAVQGESGHETIEALKRIVKLYDAWDAADPGKGYAEKAAKWRGKLPEENGE